MDFHNIHIHFLLFLFIQQSASQVNRLPIGSIFDETTQGNAREGFKFEIVRYNNHSDSFFKMDSLERITLSTSQFNFTKIECDILENGVFVVVSSTSSTTQALVESFSKTFHVPHIITSEPTSLVAKFALPTYNNLLSGTAFSELLSKGDSEKDGGDAKKDGDKSVDKKAKKELLKETLLHLPSPFTPSQLISSSSSSSSSSSFTHSPFSLYLRPRFEAAYFDLFNHFKWNKFYYIYDSPQGLSHLEHLYSIINQRSRSFSLEMVFIEDIYNAYESLRAIDQAKPLIPKYVFLDLSSENAFYTLLSQIMNLGMHRFGYHYVVAGSYIDLVDMTTFKYGGVNISGFRLVDKDSKNYRRAVADWRRYLSNHPHKHLFNPQHIPIDTAINMDAVGLLERGLRELFEEEERLLSMIFKKGVIHNDGVRGVRCSDPHKPWKNGSTVMEYLKKVTFNGLTGHVAFNDDGFRKSFSLDLLDMGLNRPLTKIGTWNEETGINIQATESQNGSRSRHNATIIITTVMESPYVMLRKRQESDDGTPLHGNDRFEGFCADVAAQVGALVNYKYILKEVDDKKYGEELSDGSWNGMIGELTRREADMAIAPLTITSIRERVLDFSKPFMNLGISIMIKKPEKQKPGVFSFMDPIDNYIWTLICISYLGVSFTLFLVCRFSPYEWNDDATESDNEKTKSPFTASKLYRSDALENIEISCYEKCDGLRQRSGFDFAAANNDQNHNNGGGDHNNHHSDNHNSPNNDGDSSHSSGGSSHEEKPKTDFTLKNSFWFVLGAFMQQGVGLSPKSISGRLVGSSWWFFTLIIISSYTANLAAFLTVERMLTPINGADDLVKQSEILYGTLDSGSSKAFFEKSNITVYKQMWSFMRSSDPSIFVKKTELGVDKVRNSKGKYAFLLETTMNEYHNQRKPCNTMRVGENLDSKGYGIATPIGHPLKVPVGLAILKMKEIGKLAKLQKKWWYDKGECPADADGKGGGSFQSAMTLSNVAGIFYILISGLGVSMVVSLLEFLSKTCHDARKNKVKFSKMIQEKLKLPTSSEESEICEQDQPSSSHQLISQANHYFSKSSPLTASSSLRGKPATLPKRFNPQILTSPSLESTFRQAAIQQQQQQQQQQQYIQQQQQQQQRQSFYLQQLHHPPYNNNNQQLILPQQLSSSAASPLQMKDFKNEGDFLNRQYNFHSDLDPPSITSDNFSSKCLVPAVRSSSVSLV